MLIVDDEPLARRRIADLLASRKEFDIVGECANGKDAVTAIRSGIADLVFLDIQMKDMDGFDVLKKSSTASLPKIIFVTAYDHYALKAFEVHAVDYLLKPFDDERFQETLNHVREQIKRDEILELRGTLSSLLEDLGNKNKDTNEVSKKDPFPVYTSRLAIRSTGKISFLEVDEIDWIGAEGSYVSLHVKGKSTLMRGSLKKLEKVLDPRRFLRIHRSTIVNVSLIKEMKPQFHGDYMVILKNGERLTLSRGYREKAEHLLEGKF